MADSNVGDAGGGVPYNHGVLFWALLRFMSRLFGADIEETKNYTCDISLARCGEPGRTNSDPVKITLAHEAGEGDREVYRERVYAFREGFGRLRSQTFGAGDGASDSAESQTAREGLESDRDWQVGDREVAFALSHLVAKVAASAGYSGAGGRLREAWVEYADGVVAERFQALCEQLLGLICATSWEARLHGASDWAERYALHDEECPYENADARKHQRGVASFLMASGSERFHHFEHLAFLFASLGGYSSFWDLQEAVKGERPGSSPPSVPRTCGLMVELLVHALLPYPTAAGSSVAKNFVGPIRESLTQMAGALGEALFSPMPKRSQSPEGGVDGQDAEQDPAKSKRSLLKMALVDPHLAARRAFAARQCGLCDERKRKCRDLKPKTR